MVGIKLFVLRENNLDNSRITYFIALNKSELEFNERVTDLKEIFHNEYEAIINGLLIAGYIPIKPVNRIVFDY